MGKLKEASVPLYQQLMDDIKTNIATGTYALGDKIPSETELSEMYGVSRITVRRAIEELCREHYLKKYQGKGTFVNQSKVSRKIRQTKTQSFSEVCYENGMRPDARVLYFEKETPDADMTNFYGLEPHDTVLHIMRLRSANDVPIMLENTFLPAKLYPTLRALDLEHSSLFQIVAALTANEVTDSPETTLDIVRATIDQASLLDVVVGEPLFYMRAYFTDQYGQPLILGRQYVVGSRFTMSI